MQQITKKRVTERYNCIILGVLTLLVGVFGLCNTTQALTSYDIHDYAIVSYDSNSSSILNGEPTTYTSTHIVMDSNQYSISSEWFFGDTYKNYQNQTFNGHYLFLDTTDDNAYPPPARGGKRGTVLESGGVNITGLVDGNYFVYAYNSFDYLFFTIENGLITETGNDFLSPPQEEDNFIASFFLPDDTPIQTGYDYIGENFNAIKISLDGTNFAGLYDTFRIRVYKDGELLGTKEIPITVSCTTCNFAEITLDDFSLNFLEYSNYYFNFSMDSILINSLEKNFTLSFNLVGNSIIYDECTNGDFFCYIKNAFRWAFFVPPSTFNQFIELKDLLANKAPFGYITEIYNSLGTITNDENNKVFILEEVTPITNNIFNPIRTALVWLLYFAFALALFNRFKNIEI